jgi:hypothetical protein
MLRPEAPKAVVIFNTSLADPDLVLLAETLLHVPNLRKLDLSYTRVEGRSLGALAGIESLTDLDLSHTPISGEGLRELAGLCRLTSVGLNGTYLPLAGFAFFVSRFAHSLSSLELSGATVFGPGLQPAGAPCLLNLLGQFTRLDHLALDGTLANPRAAGETKWLSDLSALAFRTNLKALDLSNNNLADRALEYVAKLKGLTELKLAGNKHLSDKGLQRLWPPNRGGMGATAAGTAGLLASPLREGPFLAASAYCAGRAMECPPGRPGKGEEEALNHLKKVDLSDTGLMEDTLWNLTDRNRQIEELFISGTPTLVTPLSAAALDNLSKLVRLDISDTGVNDPLFRLIWEGNPFPCLRYLDISGTMVTDNGLATDGPPPAVGFPNLYSLYTADTGVTQAGVNRREALLALFVKPKAAGARALEAMRQVPPPPVLRLRRVEGRMPR